MRDLEGQIATLRERQAAREVVDRAKRQLEESQGLSEPAAFAALRRAAMDGRVTLAEAAAQIMEQNRQI
jgi:response regulator NasT